MSREQYLENRRRQEKGVQEKGMPRERSGQETDSKKNGAIRAVRRCHLSRTSREGGVQEKSGSGGREIKERCPNKRNAKRKRRRRNKNVKQIEADHRFGWSPCDPMFAFFPSFPQFRNFQRPDCPGCPGSTFIMLCWCTYASRTCMWRHDWAPMRFS